MTRARAAADVDVVVPVHGGWEHVEPCLRALGEQSVPVNVVVVDDASPDDTADRIARVFPELPLLRNEANSGFAVTVNRGIRHGTAPIVVILNSDVIVTPTFAATVAGAFDAEGIGSVAPMLLGSDGMVDSLGITVDATAAGFVRFHGASVERADPTAPTLVGPYGAAAAYRRDALEQVGLLDENIFMYGEELDLALRLRAAGWGARGLDTPIGTHLGGASIGVGSPRQRFLAGFGRGYLLRAWGVLRSRYAIRALATEAIVCARRLILHRDVKSFTGRMAGWRAAKGIIRPPMPTAGVDREIGFARSIAMRSSGYWRP